MNNDDFLRLSFGATILYGLSALIGLLAAGIWIDSRAAVALALIALGCSYLSQHFATDASYRIAVAAQIAAVLAWMAGLYAVIVA